MLPAILLLLGSVAALPAEHQNQARVAPALDPNMRWDYPLGKAHFEVSDARDDVPFYSIDLLNTTAETIKTLQDEGHYIACYFSAGSREQGREDYDDFPPEAVGAPLRDWPKENWVDVRNEQIRQVMTRRIDIAAEKGCNGVDPDNTDGYLPDNDAQIYPNMTSTDAIDFVKFLCATANAKGMQCGLKNGGDLAATLVQYTDWEINEECAAKEECVQLKPVVDAGKPVFHVEYVNGTVANQTEIDRACAPEGFSSIIKHIKLDDDYTTWCK